MWKILKWFRSLGEPKSIHLTENEIIQEARGLSIPTDKQNHLAKCASCYELVDLQELDERIRGSMEQVA